LKTLIIKIATGLSGLSAVINRYCLATAAAFMLVMLAAVGLQVVARYVFFSPPSWTEELARYCMIWAGYLGATVSFYRREDPVLMGRRNIRAGTLSVFYVLVRNIAVLLFIVPIVYWSPVIIGHHMLRKTESMEVVSGYVMLIVPLFATIIGFHVVARVLTALVKHDEKT
jgi:TRAP-type C4-dicarboxylate transport system permease small subunit